jgi:molybdopterin converting factor small subunit
VLLPALLAREAGGQARFDTDATTLRDALRELPVRDLCIDEHGELRRLVNVYVDRRDVRDGAGLDTGLGNDTEVRIVTAIAGG